MTCLAIWQIDWGKVAEIIATSAATLAAAYFGAKFAFDMQVRRENTKQVSTNVDNANIAMFTIRRFRNLFNGLIESIEEPDVPFHDHHLVLKPFPPLNVDGPSFSYDGLAFLLKSDEKLLFRLAALQSQLTFALDLIRQRSELHYNVVQPAIEALQIEHKLDEVPSNFPQMLAEKLGPRLDAVMESLTAHMISSLKEGIEQCNSVANDLAKAVENAHPNRVKRRVWASGGSA